MKQSIIVRLDKTIKLLRILSLVFLIVGCYGMWYLFALKQEAEPETNKTNIDKPTEFPNNTIPQNTINIHDSTILEPVSLRPATKKEEFQFQQGNHDPLVKSPDGDDALELRIARARKWAMSDTFFIGRFSYLFSVYDSILRNRYANLANIEFTVNEKGKLVINKTLYDFNRTPLLQIRNSKLYFFNETGDPFLSKKLTLSAGDEAIEILDSEGFVLWSLIWDSKNRRVRQQGYSYNHRSNEFMVVGLGPITDFKPGASKEEIAFKMKQANIRRLSPEPKTHFFKPVSFKDKEKPNIIVEEIQ